MTLPANGDTLSGVVLLSALADGAGIAGLQFLVNGANLGSEIVEGSCSAEWNTRSTPDGTYILSALVRDEIGNLMPTTPVVVNVTNAAPEISAVAAQNVSDSSAVITWLTGQTSTSQVEYGPTSSYGSLSPMVDALVSNHSVLLSGLAPNTMYHFRVHSLNWRGTIASSGDFVLATGSGGGGCVTPDPFLGLGGGTCWNGGWLPPGIAPPGGGTVPPYLGPAPTPDPPLNSICGGPDPFAGIGGGTCWNGGWVPPGMAPPVAEPAPTPAPAPTLPVLGPPTSSIPFLGPPLGSSVCQTPDPFAMLGGGTCWNGGWFPPGFEVPTSGATSTSTPSLGPAPAPAGYQTCPYPDPFSTIPGYRGLCINGGWVPTRIDGI